MPLNALVSQLTILAFAGLVVWAAIKDVQSFTIPNRICAAIAGLYPAFVLSLPGPVDWQGALIAAGAVLAIGFLLFLVSFRGLPLMGAGDTKLLAACTLWAGPALLSDLLVVMALAGGLLAVYGWLRHRDGAAAATPTGAAITGALLFLRVPFVKLPYGLAICAGALYVAVRLLLGV